MAKKKVEIAPVQPVELTPEQKMERVMDRIANYLGEPGKDLQEKTEAFLKSASEGGYSYAIEWHAYGLMVEEHLEKRYMVGLRALTQRVIDANISVVLTLRDTYRGLRAEYAEDAMKSWNVEWDSSTSPIANQKAKAENRARQRAYEAIGHCLNAIEWFMEEKV